MKNINITKHVNGYLLNVTVPTEDNEVNYMRMMLHGSSGGITKQIVFESLEDVLVYVHTYFDELYEAEGVEA